MANFLLGWLLFTSSVARAGAATEHQAITPPADVAPDELQQPLASGPPEETSFASAARAPPPRTDFSRLQLKYLGRDRVLSFNQWSGDYALWALERSGRELSKCDPLAWPPLSSGRWAALRYTEFEFAGKTALLNLNPRTGALTHSECDETTFLPRCRGEPLRCKPSFSAALAGRGEHSVVYLGRELLLHYERLSGRYSLLRFTRCANGTATAPPLPNAPPLRCGLSAPLAEGTLAAGAYHTYAGADVLLSYLPHAGGAYELRRVVRAAAGAAAAPAADAPTPRLARLSGGAFAFHGSWSTDARRHRLTAAHAGAVLDYDKEDGSYRLLQLEIP